MRGPKRQPTALRVMRGNPGKRHRTRVDPAPGPLTDLDTPAELIDPVSRAEWDRVAPALVACGIATKADRMALIGYCHKWAQWLRLEDAAAKEPPKSRQFGARHNLAFKAYALLLRSAAELGMTPAARSKVNAVPVASAPVSKWAGLK